MSEKKINGVLWSLVGVLAIVFMVTMLYQGEDRAKEKLLENIGLDIESVVYGEYKDYEFEYGSIHFMVFKNNDRITINEIIKSVVDNKFHELADTVYDTELRFKGGKVYLKLDAVYKDTDMHKELGIEEYMELESKEYWEKLNEFILDNFKYKIEGKIDLREFIKTKEGQCYSLAELGYVLGKEKGENVRMLVNETHAWNEVEGDVLNDTIDFTIGMEDAEDEENDK